MVSAVGPDRVGLRISREHNIQGTVDEDHDDVLTTYGALHGGVVTTYGALHGGIAGPGLVHLSVLHDELEGEFVQGLPVTPADSATFCTQGAVGCTEFPFVRA